MTHPGANTVLALRIIEHDRHNSIRDITNLCLPIPPQDCRSSDTELSSSSPKEWTLPGRREGELHQLRDTVAVHQIGELDLDVGAVRARGAVVDSDSGIVSWGEIGKGKVGATQFAVGTRALKSNGCRVVDSMHPKYGARSL